MHQLGGNVANHMRRDEKNDGRKKRRENSPSFGIP
jgi:hypothetical protein